MNQCSVCLADIDEDHITKTLTCGHKFHYRCYMNIVHHSKNYFINCPLCRNVNTNIKKPFDDSEKNLKLICARKVGKVRCVCKTKNGKVCKNKASLFNYGMCHVHHKNILKKNFYKLMDKYIDFILCQRYNFLSRLFAIDIGKKLIIKHANENTDLQDILIFWFQYLNKKNIKTIQNYGDVYEYYELEKPSKKWIGHCSSRYMII